MYIEVTNNTIYLNQVKVTDKVFMNIGSGTRLLALNCGSHIYYLCDLGEKETQHFLPHFLNKWYHSIDLYEGQRKKHTHKALKMEPSKNKYFLKILSRSVQ